MPKRLLIGVGFILALTAAFIFVLREPAAAPSEPDSPTTRTEAPAKETPAKPTFAKDTHSLDDPASIWVVVNKKRPLDPLQYTPNDLSALPHSQRMRREAAKAITTMFAAAEKKGLILHTYSGYRSYSRQQQVYGNYVDQYGQAEADTFSARPGYSEHQTGLAMDVGDDNCRIEDCFADTAEGKWVAANAYKYGYIVRYPKNKDKVTGYKYEPWHIRYVGVALATEMRNQGITTLEEFFDL